VSRVGMSFKTGRAESGSLVDSAIIINLAGNALRQFDCRRESSNSSVLPACEFYLSQNLACCGPKAISKHVESLLVEIRILETTVRAVVVQLHCRLRTFESDCFPVGSQLPDYFRPSVKQASVIVTTCAGFDGWRNIAIALTDPDFWRTKGAKW
jgi:hypothetical protein